MPSGRIKRKSRAAPRPIPPPRAKTATTKEPALSADIDPQLLEQLDKAGASDQVEAVILVQSVGPPGAGAKQMAEGEDPRGPGGELLDRARQSVPEEPSLVRFMPRLGVLVVKASALLIRKLIGDPAVLSATVSGTTDKG